MVMLFSTLLAIPLLLVVITLIRNDLPWLEAPGPFNRLAYYLGNNEASTSIDSPYVELHPHSYPQEQALLFNSVVNVIKQLGWEIIQEDSKALTLHAVVTTPLFKFKDDVYINIRNKENERIVNVRSKSRMGKGDLGTNTRHVLDFYSHLNQTVFNLKNNPAL